MLDHAERRDRIVRELESKARKLRRARAPSATKRRSSTKSPISSSIPGRRRLLRSRLSRAAARGADHDAGPPSAFLPGRRRPRRAEGSVPRGRQHVSRPTSGRSRRTPSAWSPRGCATRKFFWDADRRTRLEDRLERLRHRHFSQEARAAIATRRSGSRRWRARSRRTRSGQADRADAAATAARLAKADLTTDMVFEFPELQGTMGGIYAREEGHARAGLEGHLLSVPADRRRSGRSADAGPARRCGGDLGRRVGGRQGRHTWRRCSAPARSRPARAIRSRCGVRPTA